MNTNDFALTILFGIKKFLAWIGIPSHMLDKMDELLFLIVIVIIAFIVAGIVHAVLVHLAKKILKRKRVGFFESMFKYGVFRKLTAIIPPLIGFRPAAIRFQQRFRLVHPEREDHLDLFFHRPDYLRKCHTEHGRR